MNLLLRTENPRLAEMLIIDSDLTDYERNEDTFTFPVDSEYEAAILEGTLQETFDEADISGHFELGVN
jgi:hypothetical protein